MNNIKIAKELVKMAEELVAFERNSALILKREPLIKLIQQKGTSDPNVKSYIKKYDEHNVSELTQKLMRLISSKRVSESNVKNLVKKYEELKIDYLDIDLLIRKLNFCAFYNEQYESDINKVCKILEKL